VNRLGVEEVKKYFENNDLNYEIIEFEESTETVELASKALNVEPALIAKTLSFKLKDRNILIVTKGDAKVDNKKYKETFNIKAKMLKPEEVLLYTGYPVGGVCPFGLKNDLDIYLDVSLKNFNYIYPAAGSKNSAVKLTPEELQEITNSEWIDVCK
jgi:Cys-tRNA(Pro) deacylase